MSKEVLKGTQKGPKKRVKANTITVKGTITHNQRIALQKLIGFLGSNEQDVVGKILTLWLYNEGFLKINEKGGK
ncbi:hypothetical protein GOV12_06820 [Candidatus Pacearchaeota archaeon]|nr:hypothetical protein [Candidatus Pacearchaeota archaeon]